MADIEEKICVLNNFKVDYSDLNHYLLKPNIFRALRIETQEIRHSNFLAWLLNSRANHGVGSQFLSRFLQAILNSKWDNIRCINSSFYDKFDSMTEEKICKFVVDRERYFVDKKRKRRYIDLLLVNKEYGLVVCIENKVKSLQHDGQLEAYENFVENISEYQGYDKLFLYLTPLNENINCQKWIRIHYGFVLNSLDDILKKNNNINVETRIYLENYSDTLRRDIMHKDEELRKICQQIYFANKDALDIIFEYIKNPLTEIITNNLDEAEAAGKIQQIKSNTGKKQNTEFRFTTKRLDELVPPHNSERSKYWNTPHRILYNIIVEKEDERPNKIHCTAMLSSLSGKYGERICKICERGTKKGIVSMNGRVYCKTILVDDSIDFFENLDNEIKHFINQDISEFENKLKNGGIESV